MDAFDVQIELDDLRLDLPENMEVIIISSGPAIAGITVGQKAAVGFLQRPPFFAAAQGSTRLDQSGHRRRLLAGRETGGRKRADQILALDLARRRGHRAPSTTLADYVRRRR